MTKRGHLWAVGFEGMERAEQVRTVVGRLHETHSLNRRWGRGMQLARSQAGRGRKGRCPWRAMTSVSLSLWRRLVESLVFRVFQKCMVDEG